MKNIIISVDGASSTGKSSLAKALAKHYRFKHIDSGAMYRALTFYSLNHQLIDKNHFDIDTLVSHLPKIEIDFSADDFVMLNGKIIENEVRSIEVSNYVSIVAKETLFRKFMVAKQRELGKRGNVVMDGRDIGSVVFPDSTIKFYIEASIEVRAKRRFIELTQKNIDVSLTDVISNIENRDHIDSIRDDSPLVIPENAIILANNEDGLSHLIEVAISKIDSLFQ
ncbi:(d)CMP kinase [Flavobacteriaceae bacterium]|nr:(d)CMP kinase [Flavobacteriaceae bacterium]